MTISNLGDLGTSAIFPLMNWPEAAILGVAAWRREPHYVGDAVQPRLMLPITLEFDHRVINGADGARSLRYFKGQIAENFTQALSS